MQILLKDTPTRARGTNTPHMLDLVIVNNSFVEGVKRLAPLGKSDQIVLDIAWNFSRLSIYFGLRHFALAPAQDSNRFSI